MNDDGTWQANLTPLAASDKGRELTAVSEGENVVVADVVVGDVWQASGQSNMAMNVQAVAKHFSQAEADMAAAKLPTFRFRRIDEPQSAVPGKDIPIKAGWAVCSPDTVGGFSAAAFYFARKLQEELDVPIGNRRHVARRNSDRTVHLPAPRSRPIPATSRRVGIRGSRRSARHLEIARGRASP